MSIFRRVAPAALGLLLSSGVAHATTLATFEITDGIYNIFPEVIEPSGAGTSADDVTVLPSEFFITGNFAADWAGAAALNPDRVVPLSFGASITVNDFPTLTDTLPTVPGSINDVLAFADMIGGFLDAETGGGFSMALAYMISNPGFADTGLDFGYGTLFFEYGLTSLTATSLSGNFAAQIVQNDPLNTPSISELVNAFLFDFAADSSILPTDGFTPPPLAQQQSAPLFIFPDDDAGTFAVSLSVTAVPLPAGLPLLAVGLLGFATLRRRQKALAA